MSDYNQPIGGSYDASVFQGYNPGPLSFFGPGRRQYATEFVEKNFSDHPRKLDIINALDTPVYGWGIDQARNVLIGTQGQLRQRTQATQQKAQELRTTSRAQAEAQVYAGEKLLPIQKSLLEAQGQDARKTVELENLGRYNIAQLGLQGQLGAAQYGADATRYAARQAALAQIQSTGLQAAGNATVQRLANQGNYAVQQLANQGNATVQGLVNQGNATVQRLSNEGQFNVERLRAGTQERISLAGIASSDRQAAAGLQQRQREALLNFAGTRANAGATILSNASQRRFL